MAITCTVIDTLGNILARFPITRKSTTKLAGEGTIVMGGKFHHYEINGELQPSFGLTHSDLILGTIISWDVGITTACSAALIEKMLDAVELYYEGLVRPLVGFSPVYNGPAITVPVTTMPSSYIVPDPPKQPDPPQRSGYKYGGLL